MAGKKNIKTIGFYGWTKPTFSTVVKTNKQFTKNFHGAMLYAHYEMSSMELKKEVVKYLKSLDTKHPLLDKIKDIHENRLAIVGKYMYILNNGGDIPDKVSSILMSSLEKVINAEEIKANKEKQEADYVSKKDGGSQETNEPAKAPVSIQDRLREKVREVASEVEGWVDDQLVNKKLPPKTLEEFVSLFKANDLKGPHMKMMQGIFNKRIDELREAVEGKNKELNEAYSNFSKVELKKFLELHENLLKATGMLQDAAKVVRAPRQKKPVSQEKIVSRLKYKKEDTTLGIVSQSPIQIIGSKEVWVYNTKTRKLGQYKALDERGLLVKGASIENFSSDSKEKTVRKPAETLADFKKASKVKLRTFLKEIPTLDILLTGKINEHHVILRIDK